jgi:hypothetical protein
MTFLIGLPERRLRGGVKAMEAGKSEENAEPAGLRCSFCERSAEEVRQLTTSPVDETIAICDRCIREFFRQLPPEPEAGQNPEPA